MPTLGPTATVACLMLLAAPDPFPWSDPVGGLAVRVEHVDRGWYTDLVVLVGMRNATDRPLIVPMGNPFDRAAPRDFELQMRRGEGPWRPIAWHDANSTGKVGDMTGNSRDRPPVTLQPGGRALAYLAGLVGAEALISSDLRIVLRQTGPVEGQQWRGVVRTPPYAIHMGSRHARELAGRLAFPQHFPEFSNVLLDGLNAPAHQSDISKLFGTNRELVNSLVWYGPAGAGAEMHRRAVAAKELDMKLLMSALAAMAGNEQARAVLRATVKSTDYYVVHNLHDALRIAMTNFSEAEGPPAPDWLAGLAIAALSDHREVTKLEKARPRFGPGTRFTVAEKAERAGLAAILGWQKCPSAVPLLIELATRESPSTDAITALGRIGDRRAVGVLIDLLKRFAQEVQPESSSTEPQQLSVTAWALGRLKPPEAVPVLLEHVEFPAAIETLGEIGDARALPTLRRIARDNGEVKIYGRYSFPQLGAERHFAARLALACMEEGDAVARLCALLAETGHDWYEWSQIARCLADRPTPQGAAALLKAVAAHRDHPHNAGSAIEFLSAFKCRTAVEGLIGCFDIDFDPAIFASRLSTPVENGAFVALSLRKLTGQRFGADKQQWLTWWRANAPAPGVEALP